VRVRITAFAVAVFAVAFAGAAALLVVSVQHSLEEDLRDQANNAIQFVGQQVKSGESPDEAVSNVAGPARVRVLSTKIDGSDGSGAPGGPTKDVQIPPGDPGPSGDPRPAGAGSGTGPVTTGGQPGSAGDILVFGMVTGANGDTVSLVSAAPLQGVRDSVDTLRNVLVLGTPMLIALVALGVWVLVGRALRPVELLRTEVDEITHTTLDRRVHTPGSHDEVERLALTMNGMLDRLEAASTDQRRFVSDASHELRTPLAVIRATVDVARRHPDAMPPADALDRISAAADRSEQLVEQLLTLAQLDERRPLATSTIAFDELVRATPVGPESDVTIGPLAALDVEGDRELLRRVVDNLVGNAIRHARSQVTVTLEAEGADGVLHVDDDGPGIPAERRDDVFARFVRLDDARTGEGHGLGLAIVAATVERHGGQVRVHTSPAGGARFTVVLPATTRDGPDHRS
jgi:signal transduction histidine kinase